jgi:hypothetical protein
MYGIFQVFKNDYRQTDGFRERPGNPNIFFAILFKTLIAVI